MSKKRVSIFGSYSGGSIGDTAILVGLISSLNRVYGEDIDISVLSVKKVGIEDELASVSVRANVTEYVVFGRDNSYGKLIDKSLSFISRAKRKITNESGLTIKKFKTLLSGCDMLLIGGGNLIMDLYPAWPPILKDVCDSAQVARVPYGFIGVGASPIHSVSGKLFLKGCLDGARFVYFRDEYSKIYCHKTIGFSNSFVGPDLAFGIDWVPLKREKEDRCLCLNVAAVYSRAWPETNSKKFDKYIQGMVFAVDRLVNIYKLEKIYIYNSNFPLDDIGSRAFMNQFESAGKHCVIEYLYGKKTVGELLTICSKASLSLVTRLHAGIIASLAGSKVIAVEYQPKVKDVLLAYVSDSKTISMEDLMSGAVFQPKWESGFLYDEIHTKITFNIVDNLIKKLV
ncbi:MAG: polysaccharide pyruvyl transferase family protein [Spirochaetales bacterium]|jgi:polysaccharide pyruvyl transferase WcaK-like protein|nr:polysaccharide pyruvyl transferase family protein [Spirochaetales bacterium]